MKYDELIETCKEQVLEGKAYHEIKAELEHLPLEAPQIKMALQKTDEMIVAYELEQQAKEKYLIQMLIGVMLVILGLLLNIFSSGNSIWLGLILMIGAWLAYRSYQKYRSPPTLSMTVKEKKKGKFERF